MGSMTITNASSISVLKRCSKELVTLLKNVEKAHSYMALVIEISTKKKA
jgi:hypothetical protein